MAYIFQIIESRCREQIASLSANMFGHLASVKCFAAKICEEGLHSIVKMREPVTKYSV
jgi:hypothetical protein